MTYEKKNDSMYEQVCVCVKDVTSNENPKIDVENADCPMGLSPSMSLESWRNPMGKIIMETSMTFTWSSWRVSDNKKWLQDQPQSADQVRMSLDILYKDVSTYVRTYVRT